MNIGIIGLGIVGNAIKYGFEKLGHAIKICDPKYGFDIGNIIDTDICFICVPTPSETDGSCNISIVQDTIDELNNLKYHGIICIKSTVIPGTTQEMINNYTELKICFVPEFLRERCAISDFIENHDICIIGTNDIEIFNKIKELHGKYPKQFFNVTPTEAELCKYFNNIYNATLIIFANSFYEICKLKNSDYTKIKNIMTNISHITDKYLDCNENFRGFGGVCLPKDTRAIDKLCKEHNINVDFFETLLKENSKYKTTVFEGMRIK